MAMAIQTLEDERMESSQMPLLVLSEEVIFYSSDGRILTAKERPMSKTEHKFGFATRQLPTGYDPAISTGSRAVPIYQTTAYDLQSSVRAARLFALQEAGNIYTRISNPTSNIFEQRIADLEGGAGALEASSGHAAQMTAIFAICEEIGRASCRERV